MLEVDEEVPGASELLGPGVDGSGASVSSLALLPPASSWHETGVINVLCKVMKQTRVQ